MAGGIGPVKMTPEQQRLIQAKIQRKRDTQTAIPGGGGKMFGGARPPKPSLRGGAMGAPATKMMAKGGYVTKRKPAAKKKGK